LLIGCDTGSGVGAPGAAAGDAAPSLPGGKPVDCVLRAEQTEGPFPNLTDDLKRADIRSEPSDGSIKTGVPLRLVLRFGQVDGAMCRPVAGAIIDIWQCDALGVYSAYADAPGKKFLRGYQETDQSGTVEFITIYPGSYRPRPVHIHFSARLHRQAPIRTADAGTFVSQLYFPLELSQEIARQPPYSAGAPPSSNLAEDVPWVLEMEKDGPGWRGLLDIGLRTPLG
jgi:protocatechuate 3,4-dioxygenase beta subunit